MVTMQPRILRFWRWMQVDHSAVSVAQGSFLRNEPNPIFGHCWLGAACRNCTRESAAGTVILVSREPRLKENGASAGRRRVALAPAGNHRIRECGSGARQA